LLCIYQIALKAADLGHLCDPTSIHLRWVERLEEEFFIQGDAEHALGMPITPLFDRTKPGITKSQVAFMDIVALPLFTAMTQVYPGTQPFLEGVSVGEIFELSNELSCAQVVSLIQYVLLHAILLFSHCIPSACFWCFA
jgi:hypothetical protein